MKIMVVHPTGNQNVRNAALSFYERNKLFALVTNVSFNTNKFGYSFLPKKILKILEKRDFNKLNRKVIEYSLSKEILRIMHIRYNKFNLINKYLDYFSTANIFNKLSSFASGLIHKNLEYIYAYENCALEVFKKAKKKNIKCIYELNSIYWRQRKNLNFSKTKNLFYKYEDKLIKDKEIKLSDLIIVPSKNIKDSLKLYPSYLPKVKVIEYGFPNSRRQKSTYRKHNSLKVMYVGSNIPEKGTKYLIDSLNSKNILKIENKIELSIVTNSLAKEYFNNKIKMKKKIYTNLPHKEVLNLMNKNHILIVPSISEGFGMVVTEAMSQSMLVIGTNKTCLRDISKNNNSIVVPIKNSSIITKTLIYLKNNPKLVNKIRNNAYKTSIKYKWKDYRERLFKTMNIV